VFRVDINNPREFKVLRSSEDATDQPPRWLGVANFWRYAEVAANGRLLNTLARVPLTGEATVELDALCQPGTATGTRVAAFNPIHPDTVNLFAAVLSGDFTINGFRNRDLQGKLYPAAAKDAAETKRHRTSRLIAKLRGLITRVKNSRLYRLTARGLKAMPFASVVSTFPAPSGKPKPHETSALMSIPGEELHIGRDDDWRRHRLGASTQQVKRT
jgi:hypothetical protein